MKNLNDFSPSDLIYMFLDGKVNPLQQKSLFRALAEDDSLQSEFRDAIEVRNAFEMDKKDLMPSAALTSSLFTKAGFGSPFDKPPDSVNNPAPAPVPFIHKVASILTRPIATGIIGSLTTAAVFLLFLNPLLTDKSKNMPAGRHTVSTPGTANSSVNEIPRVTSTEGNSNPQQIKERIRYVYVEKNTGNENNGDGVSNANDKDGESIVRTQAPPMQPGNQQVSINSINPVGPESLMSANSNPSPGRIVYVQTPGSYYLPGSTAIAGDNTYAFEIRGISSLAYFPNRDMHYSNNILDNLNASFLMKIGSNQQIGLEFGRESFDMYSMKTIDTTIYETFERRGELVSVPVVKSVSRYEAMAPAFWAGIKYRYTWNNADLPGGIKPFGSVAAGYYNQIGFMFKPAVGLTYNPEGTFYFSVGIEGADLVYKKYGNYMNTNKIGLFYNMGLQF